MQKQIIFIHGGNAYGDESEYVKDLENFEVGQGDLEYKEKIRWHYVPQLQDALGEKWEVIRPDMPCDANAKYKHWKIWFEKYIPFLKEGVVLVGHSLGAMFLARYLSENELPVKPSKLLLISGVFTRKSTHGGENGEYFYVHLNNFKQLEKSAEAVYLLHSEDDFVVPFENIHEFSKYLPSAQVCTFKKHNHFLQEENKDVVALIKE